MEMKNAIENQTKRLIWLWLYRISHYPANDGEARTMKGIYGLGRPNFPPKQLDYAYYWFFGHPLHHRHGYEGGV